MQRMNRLPDRAIILVKDWFLHLTSHMLMCVCRLVFRTFSGCQAYGCECVRVRVVHCGSSDPFCTKLLWFVQFTWNCAHTHTHSHLVSHIIPLSCCPESWRSKQKISIFSQLSRASYTTWMVKWRCWWKDDDDEGHEESGRRESMGR